MSFFLCFFLLFLSFFPPINIPLGRAYALHIEKGKPILDADTCMPRLAKCSMDVERVLLLQCGDELNT